MNPAVTAVFMNNYQQVSTDMTILIDPGSCRKGGWFRKKRMNSRNR